MAEPTIEHFPRSTDRPSRTPLATFESEPEPEEDVTWKGIWEMLRGAWQRVGEIAWNPRLTWVALVAILLIAAAFRFTGLNWDQNQHLHPDERFLTMVENSLQWPKSLGDYFNTAVNPLNPYNQGHGTYVYGLFPVVLAKLLGQISGKTGYDGVYLAGRAMSGVLDMLCILLVFLTGRRLYNARVGLVGALLLALSVLDIQQSHYFTVDSSTTLFVTLALYFAVCVSKGDRWISVLALGVAFGLAVSAKISVLSFLLIIGLAYVLRIFATWKDETQRPQVLLDMQGRMGRLLMSFRIESRTSASPSTRAERLFFPFVQAGLSILLVLVVAGVVFRIVQPQAFTGPGFFGLQINPKWAQDMKYIQQLVSGQIDYPPGHQWTARPPVWYSLKNLVLWGLGLPLGLAVWASWALMAYELIAKHRWAHLLPWVWMTFTFFYQSVQFVKTIRYMYPIYPTMALMAGYGLVWLWDSAKHLEKELWLGRLRRYDPWGRLARLARPAAAVLIAFVIAGTTFWALAFTSIYTRPVSRVTASRWIYANLPKGTTMTFEVWDDAVPLNIDGHNASLEYKHTKMDLYWEDIPEKRQLLFEGLRQTEYIAETSNRLYGSIPRLPTRYPMTTRYYETLFSGELGYDKVMTFTSRPKFLGIEINDDDADETFTVYDHPKVTLFKKRPDFTMDNVQALLGGYDLERIVRVSPKQVSTAPNNLMLTDQEKVLQRLGGTWSRMFDRESLFNKLPTLTWLLALFLIGLAAFPLGFVAFRRLRDRGYILSKILGLLLVTYLSWLLASVQILPFTRGAIFGVLLLLLATSSVVAWVQRQALAQYLRARWRLMLANEVLFLLFFAVFWLIRLGNPDLWHPAMGGEKPMDFAYLNAIIKSTYFPAYDPWFAGGYINYYYYGWVSVAVLTKLTAIVPSVAYNLAIPTYFALTAMGACCVVFNLIPGPVQCTGEDDERGWTPRALRFGVVGALLVVMAGNLGELQLLLKGFQDLGKGVQFASSIPGLAPLVRTLSGMQAWLIKGQPLPFRSEWWYWNASRIMTHGEINEFPFFTFLYADLHAHLTAMPFTTLVLGLVTSFVAKPVAALAQLARDLHGARAVQVPTADAQCPDVTPPVVEVKAELPGDADLAERVAPPDASSAEPPLALADAPAPAPLAAAPVSAEPAPFSLWRIAWQRFCDGWQRVDWATALQLTLLALAVGELWCNNTWDFPTYLGISMVALAIGIYAERQCIDERGIVQLVLRAGCVAVLSMLFYRPYHAHFGSAYSSVDLWKGDRTPIDAYLIIHGTFLFILASYLVSLALEKGSRNGIARAVRLFLGYGGRSRRARYLYDLLVRNQSMGYELGWLGLILLGAVMLVLLLSKAWLLLLTLPLLVLACLLTLYRQASSERRLQTLLVAVGVALTMGVEYIVIKGDIGRMNTVFKFYLQVWILWGIAAAVALAYLSRRLATWSVAWRRTWGTVLAVLLVSVALYPLCATYGKVRDRWNPLPSGLDGMQYMTVARYNDNNRTVILENDRQAIIWMQDHIEGSPVIAEANTPLYRWGGRVSIYTGLPTIIGWDWHQKQQRAAVSGQVVDWRLQDLVALYNTRDTAEAARILRRYQVGYVYVGELEQAYYEAQGLAKFERMLGSVLEVAYKQGPVTIYRVIGSGAREVSQRHTAPTTGSATLLDWFARHWVPPVVQAEEPEVRPSNDAVTQPAGPALMLDGPVDRLPVLNDRGWNRLVGQNTIAVVLSWWLVLELVGLAAWPLVARVFPRFSDGGWGLSKGIGLLLVSYLVWIGASLRLVANSPPIAWLALLVVGVGSFFLWRRQRPDAVFAQFDRRLIGIEEALFSLAFLALVGVRVLNPDLWQPWFGGEKMMEIAFLNAITKSAYMPPYDPYFAGGYINYYYYGQFIVSTLIKLTGIVPEVAFNLAVPTFFALTVAHVFTLAYHMAVCAGWPRLLRGVSSAVSRGWQQTAGLSRPGLWAGASAALLVVLLGNLTGALQIAEQIARLGGAAFWGGRIGGADLEAFFPGLFQLLLGRAELPPFEYWYWGTRIIPNTINEFPFFSFLFADLHPHMIDIPFAVLAAALSLAVALDQTRKSLRSALRWLVIAVAVGALGVINTWDLPAFLGILGCVMLYRGYRLGRSRGLIEASISFLVLALVALLLYAPFYAHYQAQYLGLAFVPLAERTLPAYFLIIWGFFIFLLISLLALYLVQDSPWVRVARIARGRGWSWVLHRLDTLHRAGLIGWVLGLALLVSGLLAAPLLVVKGLLLFALLVPLWLAFGMLVLVRGRDGAGFLQRLTLFAGLSMLLGVEIVYMRDFLAGTEWRRMNTVFKFYMQAWVLWGVALGSALPALWCASGRVRFWGRIVWRSAFGLLLALSLIYPLMALPVRVNERFPSAWPPLGTLDGTAYMTTGIYHWPDEQHAMVLSYDHEALEWLWAHVQGTPVIAEAPIHYYREGGLRISSYTGLPTIVGAHESEQRPWDQVEARQNDAAAIYTTADAQALDTLLARYRVRYIYVGQLERAAFPGPGLDKFEDLAQAGSLARIFQNERVTIYEVLRDWETSVIERPGSRICA